MQLLQYAQIVFGVRVEFAAEAVLIVGQDEWEIARPPSNQLRFRCRRIVFARSARFVAAHDIEQVQNVPPLVQFLDSEHSADAVVLVFKGVDEHLMPLLIFFFVDGQATVFLKFALQPLRQLRAANSFIVEKLKRPLNDRDICTANSVDFCRV